MATLRLVAFCSIALCLLTSGASALAASEPPGWASQAQRQAQRDELLAGLPRVSTLRYGQRASQIHLAGALGWSRPDLPEQDVLGQFASRYGALLDLTGAETLVALRTVRDGSGGLHLRAGQTLAGYRVVGASLVLHFDALQGTWTGVDGDLLSAADAQPMPLATITREAAAAAATARFPGSEALGDPELVWLNMGPHRGRLAWQVRIAAADAGTGPVREWSYHDAATGAHLDSLPLVLHARDRRIWDANFTTDIDNEFLAGETYTCSQSNPCDADGLALHGNLGWVYDYFWQVWGRDSLDGNGMPINGTAKYGVGYNNAFYMLDLDWLVFGNGGGGLFSPLARSLDIVAHEYTHGVAKYAAGIVYSGETRAVSESLSDVFASRLDHFRYGQLRPETFLFAEDAYTPLTPGDALRYLADPAADGQSLDLYADLASNPGAAPHHAAGIGNLAFKLLVTGGSHPRGRTTAVVPALGMTVASAIWAEALDVDVIATETYADLRAHTAAAAARLYGAAQADAVHWAWDAVGVPGSSHVAPGTPATLVGASESCHGFYTALWSPGPGPGQAASYDLQYAPTLAFTNVTPLYSGAETSRAIEIPASGYLRVRACNAYGCSGWRASNWLKYLNYCL